MSNPKRATHQNPATVNCLLCSEPLVDGKCANAACPSLGAPPDDRLRAARPPAYPPLGIFQHSDGKFYRVLEERGDELLLDPAPLTQEAMLKIAAESVLKNPPATAKDLEAKAAGETKPAPAETKPVNGETKPPKPEPKKPEPAPAVVMRRGVRLLLSGMPGAGKTTFAADADGVKIIPVDDAPNIPSDKKTKRPESWEELLAIVDGITANTKGTETLVIDTMNDVAALCSAFIRTRAKVGYLDEVGGGYNKGKNALVEEMRILLMKLERLKNKNVDVILIAHAKSGKTANPDGLDYEAWKLSIEPEVVGDVLIGWCDIAAFAQMEIKVEREGGKRGKAKGKGTGPRWLIVAPTATVMWAKNRHNLPPKMELNYETFMSKLAKNSPDEKKAVLDEIRGKLARLGGATFRNRAGAEVLFSEFVEKTLASNPTETRLAQLNSGLDAKIAELFPDVEEEAVPETHKEPTAPTAQA